MSGGDKIGPSAEVQGFGARSGVMGSGTKDKDLPQRSFTERVIGWQGRHGRHDLPWQKTRDAYRIWLSEIMLQQTQVGTVIPYYDRFLARFPGVEALAGAPLEAVLELWAGLGYYARARNLHRCAQTVVAEHAGRFPDDPSALACLPGIGRSTAAAIAAFAWGARAAILDGNVKRVLARCFGIAGFPGAARVEREMWQLAESLVPAVRIEAYTQGLMDLGASVCKRASPACGQCPLADMCIARRDGRQAELPAARPRKALPERETTVLLASDGRRVLLERRPAAGIWGGLWALPECPGGDADEFARRHGWRLREVRALPVVRHAFTHFRLHIHVLLCTLEAPPLRAAEPGWQWLAHGETETAAMPAPVARLVRKLVASAH